MTTRRSYLLSGIGAFFSFPFLKTNIPRLFFLPEESVDLAIVRSEDIEANVRAAVEALGGIRAFVKPGHIVFLKPNVSFPTPPEWGATTHPVVIRTMAAMCMEAGARRVIVADFPMSRPRQCFERSGMQELADTCRDFTFLELKEESQFENVPVPEGLEVKDLAIPKALLKSDVFINLPTAKSHSATDVSFGLKNLMGLFWDRRRFHQPLNLHQAIVDLATILKPHLTIMDATYLLLTNGPQGPGKTEYARTIVAGKSPLAVDAMTCSLAEWNNRITPPERVRHLVLAAERGLGTLDVTQLRVFRKG
ncbi:MAG: DUF362 domain-containing protein [Bacteroidota bacterium]|nr:DUF362 domain-containing protein [Bacteroidota bacterium]